MTEIEALFWMKAVIMVVESLGVAVAIMIVLGLIAGVFAMIGDKISKWLGCE